MAATFSEAEHLAEEFFELSWQPIESARRDGTVIEIRFFRPWVHTGRPVETQDWSCRARYDARPFGGWRHADDGQAFAWEPTHWRELSA